TRAAEYLRPGGPWDFPSLDRVLSAAAGPGDRVVDGGRRCSGAALESEVATMAGALRARGVRRGDVVAWQLPNCLEALTLYRACWRLGAVAAPVHHAAGEADMAAALAQVEPRLVLPSIDDAAGLLGETHTPVPAAASVARPADLAVALFTSGSTGPPKAVLHTQRALAYKARVMAAVHGLGPDDAVLMPAPLAHISGLLNGVLVPGVAGMKSVLMGRWDPEAALRTVEDEAVSFMIGPPTFFVGMTAAPGFTRARVRSLRLVSCGGASVT